MDKMLKKMGVKQEEIDAEEVIIRCKEKDFVIENPQVMKVNMMGQESFQITGNLVEKSNKEDIKTIMEQANVTEEEAKKALEEEKDIAAAILKLKSS